LSTAIKVENLSKQYRLGQIGTGTFSHDLNRWWHTVRGKEDPYLKIGETNDRTTKGNSEYVWSLKDINFTINKGDAVGIIGRNGAGKSTLLKILSRVTSPTTGSVKAKGRIASLLEVGTGFHPDLSGRDNIFLNGAILGMRKAEIKKRFDEIVDFAGVERYIDTPVKRYSSGMYVRLAFAVAAYLESEILIVDEVLAVGDAEFQKKCLGKMNSVTKGDGRTVLFVSHNLIAIQQLCLNSILLGSGRLIAEGSTRQILQEYYQMGALQNAEFYNGPNFSEKEIWFKKIFISDVKGIAKKTFFHDEEICVNYEINFNIDRTSHPYTLFLMVLDESKNRIFASESKIITDKNIKVIIGANFLVRGSYSLHTFIHLARIKQLDVVEDFCNFNIIDNGSDFKIHEEYDYGKVFPKTKWKYNLEAL
jgi:lipopolysaccharide transport system ATP-binding protein